MNSADRSGRLWIGVVCAVVERDGALLLVHQGPRDEPERGWWALPGGVVEAGETLEDALRREVFEETGLRLGEVSSLLWTAEYADDAHRGLAFIFRASCDDEADRAVDDPDGVVKEAAWVPRAEAVERLAAVPFRRVAEPAAKVLRGEVAEGSLWTYTAGDDGADRLLTVIARMGTS